MTEMMEAAKRMTTTNNTMAELLETEKNKTIDVKMQHSRQKKVVQFNNIVLIHEIPTHRLLTVEERSLIWYTGTDYRFFSLLEQQQQQQHQQQQQQNNNKVAGNNSNNNSDANNNNNNSKIERTKRIDHIRCIVLQVQYQPVSYTHLTLPTN